MSYPLSSPVVAGDPTEALRREPAVFAFCLEKNKVTTVLSSKLHRRATQTRRKLKHVLLSERSQLKSLHTA